MESRRSRAFWDTTVLWAAGSKMVADDVERCQLAASPDISADDLVDEEPWEYGEELPAFPGDVEVTAEPDAIDLGAEFAAVSAYWQCGLRTVQLSVDEVALVEAALAVA
jgi:hypothetical protein